MKLTKKLRAEIDGFSYEGLLRKWRMAPSGDPLLQGESGEYFSSRMSKLRDEGADHVGASKRIGWEQDR